MAIENNIFEEVEFWLKFIQTWELESNSPAPEKALTLLDMALKKALSDYRNQIDFIKTTNNFHNSLQ